LYAQEGNLDEAGRLYLGAFELNPTSSTLRANPWQLAGALARLESIIDPGEERDRFRFYLGVALRPSREERGGGEAPRLFG